MAKDALQLAILKSLGIDPIGVVSAVIVLKSNSAVTVTLTMEVSSTNTAGEMELKNEIKHYEFVDKGNDNE